MKNQKITTYQMAVTAVMAAVLCVLGPLTVPIGAIPISLANFVICLTAWLLGPKFGTLSVVIYLAIGLILAAGLDGIEHRMILQEPVNKNLFRPAEAEGLGLEMLPASLEEAVQTAQESEFLRSVLPEELSHRYYEEELKRCAALKNAADPAEYERIHYFNAI